MAWLSVTYLGMATGIMLIMFRYLVELFTESNTNLDLDNKFGQNSYSRLSRCSLTNGLYVTQQSLSICLPLTYLGSLRQSCTTRQSMNYYRLPSVDPQHIPHL